MDHTMAPARESVFGTMWHRKTDGSLAKLVGHDAKAGTMMFCFVRGAGFVDVDANVVRKDWELADGLGGPIVFDAT